MRTRGVCHGRIVWGKVSATMLAGILAMQVVMVVGAGPAAALSASAKTAVGTSDLTALSCPTATFCIAVGTTGTYPNAKGVVVSVTNGVPGTSHTVSGTGALFDVRCISASLCVAVGDQMDNGGEGVVVKVASGVPGAAHNVAGTTELTNLACEPSTSTCVATGFGFTASTFEGAVVRVVAGVAGPAVLVSGTGSLSGVDCTSATSCVAVGQTSITAVSQGLVLPITNGSPGLPADVAKTGALEHVACPSATRCEAVGYGLGSTGNHWGAAAVTVNSGVPSTARIVASLDRFNSVACYGPSMCEATGGTYSPSSTSATTIVSGAPGTPQRAPVFLGENTGPHVVACPTSTSCIAVGNAGAKPAYIGELIPIAGGIVGTADAVSGSSFLEDVTCPTTTTCFAVGSRWNVQGTTTTSQGVVAKITLP